MKPARNLKLCVVIVRLVRVSSKTNFTIKNVYLTKPLRVGDAPYVVWKGGIFKMGDIFMALYLCVILWIGNSFWIWLAGGITDFIIELRKKMKGVKNA